MVSTGEAGAFIHSTYLLRLVAKEDASFTDVGIRSGLLCRSCVGQGIRLGIRRPDFYLHSFAELLYGLEQLTLLLHDAVSHPSVKRG